MEISEYENILQNYHFHNPDLGVFYSLLSLSSCEGELSKKMKATLEDGYVLNERDKQKLLVSIGDVIYWASMMAIDMGYQLDDVIELNVKKLELQKRKLIELYEEQNIEQEKNKPNKK